MNQVLQQLHADHVNAARLLQLLERQIDRLDQLDNVDYGLIDDIMTYMTQYPDLFHHPKEDLLFELWEQRETGAADTVEQLNGEHRMIINSGQMLLRSAAAAATDSFQRRDELIALGRSYVADYFRHMKTEETDVFPRLAQALEEPDWASVEERLRSPQDPLFGKTVSDSLKTRFAQIRRLVLNQ